MCLPARLIVSSIRPSSVRTVPLRVTKDGIALATYSLPEFQCPTSGIPTPHQQSYSAGPRNPNGTRLILLTLKSGRPRPHFSPGRQGPSGELRGLRRPCLVIQHLIETAGTSLVNQVGRASGCTKRSAGGRRNAPAAAPHLIQPRFNGNRAGLWPLNQVGRDASQAVGRVGVADRSPFGGPTLILAVDQFGLICPQCGLDRLQHRPQLGALGVRLDEVAHPPKYRPLVGIQIARCPLLNAKTSRGNSP